MTALLVAVLCLLAVLAWPRRRDRERVVAVLSPTQARVTTARRGGSSGTEPHEEPGVAATLWQSDPVELYRARRARRGRGAAEAAALELLDAIAPALRAGLTPARAFELAAASGSATGRATEVGASPGSGHGVDEPGLGAAIGLARSGVPLAGFWGDWAARSRSADISFVASAWRLSEETGAPLAEAVDRAAAQLRAGQSRRRRIAAAVAGPRATVTVLTALPLTGPLFGMASGLNPGAMYLSSPLTATSLVAGGALLVAGRWWCGRIIAGAMTP